MIMMKFNMIKFNNKNYINKSNGEVGNETCYSLFYNDKWFICR